MLISRFSQRKSLFLRRHFKNFAAARQKASPPTAGSAPAGQHHPPDQPRICKNLLESSRSVRFWWTPPPPRGVMSIRGHVAYRLSTLWEGGGEGVITPSITA